MEQLVLEKVLQDNLYGYQKAVNEDRAVPDATTGLKPVHQRILWACSEGGYTSNKEYKKSARIVGDVIGKYHPHGDTAVYEALVRLAQNWKMRYVLIDLYGNLGNVDGDGPAAMRYTNARLAKLAEDGMLANIKKNVVDFTPNYDEDDVEPVTLPAIFPNLLCNPNKGIGWAMACEWLPHNLNDVAQAIYDYMDGKEPMLPGPDFPTGGEILNSKDMVACYKTGTGTVRYRARYKIEKNNIVFYEIPYALTTEKLIEQIKEVAEKELDDIIGVSNEHGLTIKCKKGAALESIAAKLYAKTSLQTTISFNQVALVDGKPKLLNLKQCIEIYVKHNIECLIRELNFDLNKAKARLHIVEGLLIALEDIDNVIQLIKKSESSSAAKDALMQKYNLSEEQAKAILAMRLSSLAHMEKIELENEKKELIENIKNIENILASEQKQLDIIRERLNVIVKKYGDKRRTELLNIEIKKEDKEIATVIPEDVVVVATQSGLIKKIPTSTFKVQKKGGKGIKSNDDVILDVIKTNTIDTLMFFTNKGKMYRTVVDNVPSGTNVSRGVLISDLAKIDNDEKVIAISSLHRKSTPKYIIFVTKQGMIKKSLLEEYTKTNRNGGIAALNIKDGDEVVNVIFQDEEELILITKNGMSIRFGTSTITAIGRTAAGVKGINLNDGDEVISALPVHKITDTLAIVYENGIGKKIALSEFPSQGRGGKGVTLSKDNSVVGAAMISDEDNILICGATNSICISATDIPLVGRTAIGNILIKNTKVLTITKV